MLLIGKFLAEAGMESGKHVSWLPSATAPRCAAARPTAPSSCRTEPVASPLISAADTVLAMNLPSMLKFQSEVKPGGLLLVNSSIIDEKSNRDDCDVVYVPCNHIAEETRQPQGLPTWCSWARMSPRSPRSSSEETIIEAIRVELGEKKARFLEGNIKALKAGIEYVKKLG